MSEPCVQRIVMMQELHQFSYSSIRAQEIICIIFSIFLIPNSRKLIADR